MTIKPWYKVVTPREDLREGRPLDASEFAVHLDHVRKGNAHEDYKNPKRFMERTFLTQNLTLLAGEVLRRLSGETTETSAVFNMSTQFGGGKTHALTLLYHLVNSGEAANKWPGVSKLLSEAKIKSVPKGETAVFVGTDFDSLQGRGGDDGTPLRKTPWGEIAFQLGGAAAFEVIRQHDERGEAPGGDVIRKLLPKDKPCLILMDEVMNWVSRNRRDQLHNQFYNFLQNLSEAIRGEKNLVLVVSIPKSEVIEMTQEDEADYNRLKHMLNRLGKAIVISANHDIPEIIRRRLFEWDPQAVRHDGRILLSKDAIDACNLYADWVQENRQLLPTWFQVDNARQEFSAAYPFHPIVLSVFQRKWASLPRFQQTRGVLRLLAQWVSQAYQQGFKGAQADSLIGLGSAPLQDSLFRRAAFEQLGEDRLESAIIADVAGNDSFAHRLDKLAVDSIKKTRLHQKIATAIFFESSGGQQQKDATVPEIRLAVGEPEIDIANIESVLEELTQQCYYLRMDKNHYRFSVTPNLNRMLADRRSNISPERIAELIKEQIQKVFTAMDNVERVFFPDKSIQIADRPAVTLVVLPPDRMVGDEKTLSFIDANTKEYGTSSRCFKTALFWMVADNTSALQEDARKLLAWEDIDENDSGSLDEAEQRLLPENIKKAKRDLLETIWRTYKNIAFLGRENQIKVIDLGLTHSSSAASLTSYIIQELKRIEEITDTVSLRSITRNWPPALTEWSTKSLRDAFFASPLFPRLLNTNTLKDTISQGVFSGQLAYVGKRENGKYEPFYFEKTLSTNEIEFSEDMFIITAETAQKMKEPPVLTFLEIKPSHINVQPGQNQQFSVKGLDQYGQEVALEVATWESAAGTITDQGIYCAPNEDGQYLVEAVVADKRATATVMVRTIKALISEPSTPQSTGQKTMTWSGEIGHAKWMHFYTKFLAKLMGAGQIKIRVTVEHTGDEAMSAQKLEEARAGLKELGLNDNLS